MATRRVVISVALTLASWASLAGAQGRRLELSLELPVVNLSQVDRTDTGVGLRLGFGLSRALALDATLAAFPADLGDPAFSASRFQAALGLRVARRGKKAAVFAAARGGVARFAQSPEPFACVKIYPPPLACVLAAGQTLPAWTLGGGLELYPSPRTVLRLEAADQLLRYPGPAFDGERQRRETDFWDHDLRATLGLGWRF